jgi:hypothetical protein
MLGERRPNAQVLVVHPAMHVRALAFGHPECGCAQTSPCKPWTVDFKRARRPQALDAERLCMRYAPDIAARYFPVAAAARSSVKNGSE